MLCIGSFNVSDVGSGKDIFMSCSEDRYVWFDNSFDPRNISILEEVNLETVYARRVWLNLKQSGLRRRFLWSLTCFILADRVLYKLKHQYNIRYVCFNYYKWLINEIVYDT